MMIARKKPDNGGGYQNLLMFISSKDLLREMSGRSKKVLGEHVNMNEIAANAIQEYYDRNFKNK